MPCAGHTGLAGAIFLRISKSYLPEKQAFISLVAELSLKMKAWFWLAVDRQHVPAG